MTPEAKKTLYHCLVCAASSTGNSKSCSGYQGRHPHRRPLWAREETRLPQSSPGGGGARGGAVSDGRTEAIHSERMAATWYKKKRNGNSKSERIEGEPANVMSLSCLPCVSSSQASRALACAETQTCVYPRELATWKGLCLFLSPT